MVLSIFSSSVIGEKIIFFLYMRLVQVTPSVTLKNYTFFKPLNLSRSNGQKKTLINANILIDLNYYPLFNTFYTCF